MAAGSGYSRLIEEDLSRGMFPSLAPERIPRGGAFDITNGLLDEQNVVYRRGGTTYRASTPAGDPRLLWNGFLLHGGLQTLLATAEGFWRVGPKGELTSITTTPPAALARAQIFEGLLYLPGGVTFDGEKAGTVSEKRAFYASAGGRLLAAEGSRIAFSQVPAKENEAVEFEQSFTVKVTSTAESLTATVASATGLKVGMFIVSALAGIALGTTITGISGTTITLSQKATLTAAAVAGTAGLDNYHQLPDGVQITGMEGLRTSCVVFTTEGIWVIGNVNKNLTDEEGNVQQTLDRYSADAVLWGNNGVAGWSGGLVVPCKDAVYLLELGVSSEKAAPFTPISGAILNVYRGYVAAGYKPGVAAVYRGHYFLPILSGSSVVDMLVCRLDATGAKGGRTFPWTHLAGSGSALSALAVTDEATAFLGASAGLGRVLSLAYFEPGSGVAADADGVPHPFSVTYRDILTGNMVPNLVAKARLSYRMVAPLASGLVMGFGATVFGTEWDEFDWDEAEWADATGAFSELEGEAKADPSALRPHVWLVSEKVRYARVRVSLNGTASQVSLRALELFVRADGRLI